MTEPENVLDPGMDFDLDSAVALQAEATKRPIQVKMGGQIVPFPQMSDWPWEAVEAMNQGMLLTALDHLFGDDKVNPDDPDSLSIVDFFRDLPVEAVRKLFEHFSAKSGVRPGESNRSARRSRSTRTR
jgi:hypothetical protein